MGPGFMHPEWQQAHPGMPATIPNQFNQPHQFPTFTPYAPQQPLPEMQAYAMTHQRLAHLSINSRLNRFTQNGPPPQPPQMIPGELPCRPQLSHGVTPYEFSANSAPPMSNGLTQSGGFGPQQQHIQNGRRPRSNNSYHHNKHGQQQQHGQHHGPPHQQHHAAGPSSDEFEEAPHQPTETEDMALNFLNEVINKVGADPGTFDSYQKQLKEIFFEMSGNNFVMSNALEMIFKHSIKVQNFRYMGAKVCQLLDDLDSTEQSLFRSLLRMKMDFERQELISFMASEQYTVRGTTLFLAELYMQLRRPNVSLPSYFRVQNLI